MPVYHYIFSLQHLLMCKHQILRKLTSAKVGCYKYGWHITDFANGAF